MRKKLALVFFAALFVMSACTDEENLGGAEVAGKVELSRSDSQIFTWDYSGINIYVDNETEPKFITSKGGEYEFSGVEQGIHTLRFEKENCYPLEFKVNINVSRLEVNDGNAIVVSEKNDVVPTRVQLIDIETNNGYVPGIDATFGGSQIDRTQYGVFLFYSSSSNVSYNNYEYNEIIAIKNTNELNRALGSLLQDRYMGGETIHYAVYTGAYPQSGFDNYYWQIDQNTGRSVYQGLNISSVKTGSYEVPRQ
jgi:hypothetical protein